MSAGKSRSSRSGQAVRVVTTFNDAQWDLWDSICRNQAGMDGRQALKHLVAQFTIRGCFPISRVDGEQQKFMLGEKQEDDEND